MPRAWLLSGALEVWSLRLRSLFLFAKERVSNYLLMLSISFNTNYMYMYDDIGLTVLKQSAKNLAIILAAILSCAPRAGFPTS